MIPYIPKIGELVRAKVYFEVSEVNLRAASSIDGPNVWGWSKLNEKGDMLLVKVPLVCCEPLNHEHDYEKAKANEEKAPF